MPFIWDEPLSRVNALILPVGGRMTTTPLSRGGLSTNSVDNFVGKALSNAPVPQSLLIRTPLPKNAANCVTV